MYQEGKIYRIVSTVSTKQYIGSTIQKLNARMRQHKSFYNTNSKETESFELFHCDGVDNCRIELIEEYPCSCKKELEERERYWIEKEDCINKIIPTRTDKEYYQANREQIIERVKQYYIDNIDTKKQYYKNRYAEKREQLLEKLQCECGGKYTPASKRKHERTIKHQDFILPN
jgi:hypothetical protein